MKTDSKAMRKKGMKEINEGLLNYDNDIYLDRMEELEDDYELYSDLMYGELYEMSDSYLEEV